MDDEVKYPEDLPMEQFHLNQANIKWKEDIERYQSKVETLQEMFIEVKTSIQCSEDNAKNEMDILWRRVKNTVTLLSFLKSKARSVAVQQLAQSSCGIKYQDGVIPIGRNGLPFPVWLDKIDFSFFESSDEDTLLTTSCRLGKFDTNDEAYMGEAFKSVQIITDVMEYLVKRICMAETEVTAEKEKVHSCQEEIKNKVFQISSMSTKVEEMERFALNTNCVLNEMRLKFEDMVEETSSQRQRHVENEQELTRVKQDFESLKSYVANLISVRETLLSSEKQFRAMEKLLERLIAKSTNLEAENEKKEAEIQKLFTENVRLTTMLDTKEAQLMAMNEQCKFMALNRPNK